MQADRLESAHLSACPYCSERMLIPAIDGSTDLPEESPVKRESEDELDGLRMRALALSRRSAMRARTYCLLAAVGCAYIAYLASTRVFALVKAGKLWSLLAVFWALCVAVSIMYAVHMVGRARGYERESREPLLKDPAGPPDFTPLSDGSQYSKNLEGMGEAASKRGGKDEGEAG